MSRFIELSAVPKLCGLLKRLHRFPTEGSVPIRHCEAMAMGSGGAAVSEQVVADRLSVYARDIASQCDRPASIARAVDHAAKMVECSFIDIVHVRRPGSLGLVHSSDPGRSALLIAAADAAAESPAAFCRSAAAAAVVCDLDGDDRWPRYSRAAFDATGLRSEMAIGLEGADEDWLVLRFFSELPGLWSDANRSDAKDFAELTALAIDRATLRATTQNLRQALESNRLIGAAVGIVMARHRMTYEAAFELLRLCSQNSNRKLRSVADGVVLTGELPASTDGEAA